MGPETQIGTPTPRLLSDLTWPEAQAALRPTTIVMLPVGAIEAHGPHLPLDTDVIIATTVAWRAATLLTESGEQVVVAPPITYSTSFVGACFPGTTPVADGVVTATVVSILTALARWGPRRLAIVNAHLEPNHVSALVRAVSDAENESRAHIAFPDKRQDRWAELLSAEFQNGMRHAGAYETSLMLAADPDRVRRDLLHDLKPVLVDLPAQLRSGATTFFEAGGVEGYFGDPAAANANEGERLFTVLAEMVRTSVLELPVPQGDV